MPGGLDDLHHESPVELRRQETVDDLRAQLVCLVQKGISLEMFPEA